MAVDMGSLFMRNLGELRVQPTRKRVRAKIDGETIVDSSRAVLVWEPKRVVPAYAMPVEDVVGGTGPTPTLPMGKAVTTPDSRCGTRGCHSRFARRWEGRSPSARTSARSPASSPRTPTSTATSSSISTGFDTWLEEDEEIISHPHDPFSRIDIRDSSARYQLALDGVPVVDTTRARILFETGPASAPLRSEGGCAGRPGALVGDLDLRIQGCRDLSLADHRWPSR